MPAPGALTSVKVELELNGVFTDVSAYLAAERAVRIEDRGVDANRGDAQPARLTLVLRNDDGRFTSDNPLSPYFPYLAENTRVKVSTTKGATTSVRFLGYITALTPSFGVDPTQGVVTLNAADVLSVLGTRVMRSAYVEEVIRQAALAAVPVDVYPLADADGFTALRNVGIADATTGRMGKAVIVPSVTGLGSYSTGQADGLNVDGAITFAPDQSGVGPVLRFITTGTSTAPGSSMFFSGGQFNFWLKVPRTVTTAGCVLSASTGPTVGWSLRLAASGGNVNLAVFDSSGSNVATLYTAINDDGWHLISINCGITVINFKVDGGATTAALTAAAMTSLTAIHLGGFAATGVNGKNTLCQPISVAAVNAWRDGGAAPFPAVPQDYARPSKVSTVQSRYDAINAQVGTTILAAPVLTGSGTAMQVGWTDQTGRTALDVLTELARTVSGVYWSTPAGVPTLVMPDSLRTTTLAATVALDADDDIVTAEQIWQRAVDSIPSRVTVTSPAGDVTLVRAGETVRRDQTVQSCAATEAAAYALAGFYLNRTAALRLAQLGVDLAVSANDLHVAFWALKPGDRLRVTGVNSTIFGETQTDVFLSGWTEEYRTESSRWVLDTTPADSPPEALWADATYGRWSATATVTGGTAVGTTANGTLIIATTGAALSTAAGDYPVDLDWLGERVTITSPPASSTSPQTVTTTARGVSPTVARVHAAGEKIDAWLAMSWAP